MTDDDVVARPTAPSRRSFLRSIGLLLAAMLPVSMVRTSSTRDIIIVDGWILADTDLR